MKKRFLMPVLVLIHLLTPATLIAGEDEPPSVLGLCIAAPNADEVDRFTSFMENTLAPGGINTLVLRVDYNYEYKSHPELQKEHALSRKDVKKLVNSAQKHGIRLIPQINLLGHQSWAGKVGKLLEIYPEFDETPSVTLPEEYKWPNEDGLYCKSYCPLHPGVHALVFDLVDEIVEVFEADAFHAGLDEVFYIAMDECPRCKGKDPAVLFADEVNKIHEHLKKNGSDLWIWGDRLIDGQTSGLGMWEASENNTHRAIKMIPKEVVICDWHYERADPTAACFAMEGFRVISCPWNKPELCREQLELFSLLKKNATKATDERYYGFMQTVWTPASTFMNEFDDPKMPEPGEKSQYATFKQIINYYSGKEE